MEHYPSWPNLAAMMFALARTLAGQADAARRSATAPGTASPGVSSAGWRRPAPRHLRAAGVAAGDRVVIVLGEPPGIPDRRDRADGDPRRAGADLHDQHRG